MRRRVQIVGGVVLVAALLLVFGLSGDDPGGAADPTPARQAAGESFVDKDARVILASLDTIWVAALPKQVRAGPALVTGAGTLKTACGPSPQDEGSFYCGEDRTIYLQEEDLAGPTEGSLAVRAASRVYLVAHEYGHYLQDRLGVPEGDEGKGPRSASVRYELQADCLAGVFVATQDDGPDAVAFQEAVRLGGDDVGEDPLPVKEYEHGTGQQRVAAFQQGLRGTHTECLAS